MSESDFDYEKVAALVRLALAEDIGTGDVTTEATVPADMTGTMQFVARDEAVLAGLVLLEPLFAEISRQVRVELPKTDGERVRPSDVLARAAGPMRALLTGERVALNFLTHLSGIATLTDRFVRAVEGTSAKIFDTRKTTPGLRRLEKYAVRVGGGHNHRMGLYDEILIKENHLACLKTRGEVESLKDCLKRIRRRLPETVVEVEVETLEELSETLAARPDVILLDNMSISELHEALKRTKSIRRNRPKLEISGGVTLENVVEMARTGVDRISIGMLTHSAPASDIAAYVEKTR